MAKRFWEHHRALCKDCAMLSFADNTILEYFRAYPDPRYPKIVSVWTALKRGEHKADMFRYYFLRKHGGIFVDVDIALHGTFDQLVRGGASFVSVFSTLGGKPQVMQALLAAAPGHRVVTQALDHMYAANPNSKYFAFVDHLYALVLAEHQARPGGIKLLHAADGVCSWQWPMCKTSGRVCRGQSILEADGTLLAQHYHMAGPLGCAALTEALDEYFAGIINTVSAPFVDGLRHHPNDTVTVYCGNEELAK